MTKTTVETAIRPMTLQDLDAIFLIDRKIRAMGKAITYANLTTERIFTIKKNISYLAKPISYVDLITGDVSELLACGLVAEIEGHVRGFILGKVSHVAEPGTKVGEIVILGVHPDFQRLGIATKLVQAICERFHAAGVRHVRIGLDERDKELISFFEQMGFGVGHRIDYGKTLT
ncbi:MAG: GNAT family N-acetyltransferase [Chloroflexi bacterium]|nr:GNAT family N-acetyltransferase [Chloroflexota bacterium]